jgi:predicted RNA-binding Zn-ribbon protein involved in translation (DUF1610 family)
VNAKPFVCPSCGQRGDERPGFARRASALEAIFVGDEGVAVESFECLKCGRAIVLPVGSIEVRKP